MHKKIGVSELLETRKDKRTMYVVTPLLKRDPVFPTPMPTHAQSIPRRPQASGIGVKRVSSVLDAAGIQRRIRGSIIEDLTGIPGQCVASNSAADNTVQNGKDDLSNRALSNMLLKSVTSSIIGNHPVHQSLAVPLFLCLANSGHCLMQRPDILHDLRQPIH